MIVAEAIEGSDGLCRVLFLVVVNECEALALTGDLVLGQVDSSYVAKRLEQFLQVTLLRVFRKVGNANSGSVIG